MEHYDPEACEASLAACRASTLADTPPSRCDGTTYVGRRSCEATTAEYFACIDAWNAAFTCDAARYRIPTPAACEAILPRCPLLDGLVSRDGPEPHCDPFEGEPVPDTNDDVVGGDGCRPPPTRFVVLGDSIATCFVTPYEHCGPYRIADELRRLYSPDVVFETHAVNGAMTADLPAQARQVAGGPGHLAVWIWAIGNDFLGRMYDFRDPVDLARAFDDWTAAWAEVFAYFGDAERFPDGVTFLLNTQYTPGDECPLDPADKDLEAVLREVNRRLFLDVARERPDTIAIDQYPDWLGHGSRSDVKGCPHCGPDNTRWLLDVHPNDLGHEHIAAKWSVALEGMYGGSCSR
jgi:hypothetical protein